MGRKLLLTIAILEMLLSESYSKLLSDQKVSLEQLKLLEDRETLGLVTEWRVGEESRGWRERHKLLSSWGVYDRLSFCPSVRLCKYRASDISL